MAAVELPHADQGLLALASPPKLNFESQTRPYHPSRHNVARPSQ